MGVRIAVFGTSELSAIYAASMAELGHEVLGVDIDVAKITALVNGEAPFYEPGLDDVIATNLDAGRLNFISSYAEAAAFADVHFTAVSTPQKSDGLAADVSHVDAVIDSLSPLLTRPTVIYGKSTVPVGTAARLARKVRAISPAGESVELAWNPEFLREGSAVEDTLKPDRIDAQSYPKSIGGTRGAGNLPRRNSIWHNFCGHRPCHRGTRKDFSKCLFRNKNFVHKCDDKGVRVGRCERHAPSRRNRLRRTQRSTILESRDRLRGWLFAEGHTRIHRESKPVGR